MSFTPGPWEAVLFPDGIEVVDSKGFEVVDETGTAAINRHWLDENPDRHWSDGGTESHIERPVEEMHANANLIAAAPDLLETAKIVTARYPNNIGVRELKRAIAKAEPK